MDFEDLEFSHIGRDADDGVTAEDDVNMRLREIAAMVVDDSYGDEGSVTVQLKVKRVNEKTTDRVVVVESKVKASVPSRKRQGLVGFVTNSGALVTQKAIQQAFSYDPQQVVDEARANHKPQPSNEKE